jgi:hypothetical protein
MRTERRQHPRQITRVPVRVASARESPLPSCGTIDLSEGGVLLAFEEPASFGPGLKVLLTLSLPTGRCHLIGAVRRVARGDDFRTYVAVELDNRWDEEHQRLTDHLTGPGVAEP